MKDDFQRILPFTLKWEGGDVDDPLDHGGRTSRGITQKTYDAFCQAHGLPNGDVWEATDAQVEAIYRTRFWDRILGDAIPWPLCGALFDTTVLHRLNPIVERLQGLIGVKPDGVVGWETIAAAGKLGWVNATWLLLQARDDRYEQIVARDGTQQRFFVGWEKRLDALVKFLDLPKTLDAG